MHAENKNPSQKTFQEGFNVLRTGIELYMIISKLPCLQAGLQAVQPNSILNLNYRFFW